MPNDKALFLDFSNTITTVESENEAIERYLNLLKEKYSIKDDIRAKFTAMRMEKLVDREKRFRTFMDINIEVLSELYGITEIYQEEYYRSHERYLKLRPDFKDFINLTKQSFRLVMVTDADNAYTKRTLSSLGIEKYFDSIITAENVRAPKPDSRIFETALKTAHYPLMVVFIGDSERRDIEGAKNMKFLTIKMDDDSSQTVADERVHNFTEVTNIFRARNLL